MNMAMNSPEESARFPLQRMRHLLATTIGRSGFARRSLQRDTRTPLRILVYHRIAERAEGYGPCVSPSNFEAHMDLLARHCTVRQLGSLFRPGGQEGPRGRPCVAITFDDGYRDVATHAYPCLAARRLCATVFVATDCITTGAPIWPDQLADILERATVRDAHVSISGTTEVLRLTTATEKRAAWDRLTTDFLHLGSAARAARLQSLSAQVRATDAPQVPRMLRWDDLRPLDTAILEVGSHTRSHSALAAETPDDARRELHDSRAAIATELGIDAAGFSYPNDSHQPWMRDAVRDAGYRYACHVGGRGNPIPSPDPYALQRIHVRDWPLARFVAEISPLGDHLRRLDHSLRGGRS